ncbi:MAG: transglycosylase SLT domain-containing protein [Gammaproteobacteria bacterium]
MNRKIIKALWGLKKIAPLIFCLLVPFCILQAGHAKAMTVPAQRLAYANYEKQLANANNAAFPKEYFELNDYPLFPILRYLWLKNHLQNTREITAFLNDYGYSRHADLLKRQWLVYLSDTHQWQTFIDHYDRSDNNGLDCRFYWAKLKTGHRQEALTAAKNLWTVGYSQPKECDSLFNELVESKSVTREMIWARFELALTAGKQSLADYVKRMMSKQDREVADFWLKVHDNPSLAADETLWQKPFPNRGNVFAHAIDRLASTDLGKALTLWDNKKNTFAVSAPTVDRIERRLGLALAYRKDIDAFQRLSKVQHADETVREWRVRAALLEGNWQHVETAVAKLENGEREQIRWKYWLARALAETGKKTQSTGMFENLAADRSLFGFLSAERVAIPPRLGDQPIAVSPDAMARFKQLPGIAMVIEFNAMNREHEALRQWWFMLKRLDKEQILIAAKLAQQWGWTQTAIFTVAKAEHWDDVGLRFPIDYADYVEKNAKQQALDPAIVFGLIRRESVFNQFARSPAGARGLMQIMPQTGRQIARSLKEKWQSVHSLFDPSVNVKYGTYYFKQMLDRYNGHFALAAAAYNAGPARVDRWLPKNGSMPADIWIETIPFKETREYVSAVLSYAVIYQQRLKRNALRIKDLMRNVKPSIKN